jgi:hypothetical protein
MRSTPSSVGRGPLSKPSPDFGRRQAKLARTVRTNSASAGQRRLPPLPPQIGPEAWYAAAMFDTYLGQWNLVPDGSPIIADSARLLLASPQCSSWLSREEERGGAMLMEWWAPFPPPCHHYGCVHGSRGVSLRSDPGAVFFRLGFRQAMNVPTSRLRLRRLHARDEGDGPSIRASLVRTRAAIVLTAELL